MIPASKKVNFTEVPAGLTNQLSQTFSTDEEAEIPIKEEIQTVTKVEAAKGSKKNDRPGQINICIPLEIKTDWKLLFTKNNVNITQGIIFAVEHLKNEIEKGEAILTVGGVISKK